MAGNINIRLFEELTYASDHADRVNGVQLIFGRYEPTEASLKTHARKSRCAAISIQANGCSEADFTQLHEHIAEMTKQTGANVAISPIEHHSFLIAGDVLSWLQSLQKRDNSDSPFFTENPPQSLIEAINKAIPPSKRKLS